MKATEHIEAAKKPEVRSPKSEVGGQKAEAREEEPRPPEGVSEIQKQMNKLEAQSLTSDQEAAVAEIRRIVGEAEPPPPASDVRRQTSDIRSQK